MQTSDTLLLAEAVGHLKRSDPILAAIIERVGDCSYQTSAAGTHFDAVVRAIVYQQLSGKAAATIHKRLCDLFDGRPPLPAELLAVEAAALRGVGLSRQKLNYLKSLAAQVESGALAIETLHILEDQAILAELMRLKGIGRWTAQMFLMFRLGRPNVLPEGDLGIQKAIQLAYSLKALPSPKQMAAVSEPWHPYCTIACWYLWRSLE
ncbi:DNA-3-methyladenine glycosylase family protein [Gloeobacter violaceus]|uniref:DNA-3-methyladenine glycosylase II n=1 Tax=Gloeobacter violaceus (strain ATCC 29082 / PCC 7421) TaxID=251221 RepID=Q7NJ14_GLOVI|nr:DNA-3-methyladenine glycosylase [Gloeobacter violaceus]BAC89959.1 gll2018 [Gloeobacter violaceus PCC 7421]